MKKINLRLCFFFVLLSTFFEIVFVFISRYERSVSRIEAPPFCSKDESIVYRHFLKKHVSSNNCYGEITRRKQIQIQHIPGLAIEILPETESLLKRCRENPYHAFYDCIWPLVYYISSCHMNSEADSVTLVIHANYLHMSRHGSWVDGAMKALLNGLNKMGMRILDLNQTFVDDKVFCFHSKVHILLNNKWRPPRISASAREYAQTDRMISSSINMFRNLIVSSVTQVEGSPKGHILVYDRGDARRRRWTNGFEYAYKLNRTIGHIYPVIYIWKQPNSFAEQVALHSRAIGLIAPHGASFANSLFMPPNSILVEIASRNCGEDVSNLEEQDNENAWTAWHSARLGMRLVSFECEVVRDRGQLIATDIPRLLNRTLSLLNRTNNF